MGTVLKLRRGRVVRAGEADGPEQELMVELQDGSCRRAIADVGLLGPSEVGDELIVNVQALDLGLGSGGFDVAHVNITRGLAGEGADGAHVMKLNYTGLQHAVVPVEECKEGSSLAGGAPASALASGKPVAVMALHGQLAPLAWAFAQAAPGRRLGYVQTEGGALAGGHSHTVRMLRERAILAGHITAGASYGGEYEAITTAGALAHALGALGWDAAVCGPGPGIVGSGSLLGHGGMQALDSAHTALALRAPTLIVPRMSQADGRTRHRGLSHHTRTVLELLLAPVAVAVPCPVERTLPAAGDASEPYLELLAEGETRVRHRWRGAAVNVEGYAASGLSAVTMGRTIELDPLFFEAALAGGGVLADMLP